MIESNVERLNGRVISIVGMRDAVLTGGPARKTFALLVLVVAIIAGLLAMHTLASGTTGYPESSVAGMPMGSENSATVNLTAPEPTMHASASIVTMSGAHEPGEAMIAMSCVLAPLLSSVILISSGPALLDSLGPQHRPNLGRVEATAAAPVNPPPDLLVLSISRT